MAVEVRWEPFRDREVAAIDFAAAAGAVQGVLPCSDGERQVLLVAASIAGGIPVDLREAALVHGRGERRAGRPGDLPCGRAPGAGGDGDVPVRPALPATVVITQARHPLEGRELRVLGWMRRLGRLELLLELPDGSKRLIPAEWTSQHDGPDPGRAGDAGHGGGPAGPVRAGFGSLPGAALPGAGCTKPTCQGGRSCSLSSSVCCRTRFRRHRRA